MHKCPYCEEILTPTEEDFQDSYVCNRCGTIFTEDELFLEEEEDDIYN